MSLSAGREFVPRHIVAAGWSGDTHAHSSMTDGGVCSRRVAR